MTAPLFSNTWTQRYRRPSSAVCSAQTSTTARICATGISGSDRSWRGEKQMTRQVPGTETARKSGSPSSSTTGTSGRNAAKSLVKTNVLS